MNTIINKRNYLLLLMALFMAIFAAPALAAPTVNLDGRQLAFDVPPVIEDGRTLVPLRAIFEAMGATVSWDPATQTASAVKDNTKVVLKIGSTTPTINGKVKPLDVPAKIVNGRTLAPLRFVGEAFGGAVAWDGTTQAITLVSRQYSARLTKVHFIDVGQADCIYIQLPDHNDILIDGGNVADGPAVVDYLQAQGVDDIELMVATHPHEDHIGGLSDVLAAFRIEQIIDSGKAASTKTYNIYAATAKAEGCTWAADNYQTFTYGMVTLQVLTGEQDWDDEINDYSVVCGLDTGDIEFLFMGDAETPVEKFLTGNLEAEIIKVGHHGSRSSSSPAFLKQVNPKAAVISCEAGNTYGHPHQETLTSLGKIGAAIYRTDLNGNIVFSTDGTGYFVNTDSNLKAPAEVSPQPIQGPAGKPPVLLPDTSDSSDWIAITNIDLKKEIVTIQNHSGWAVDMTGWYLVSEIGNQIYYFPDNFTLAGGAEVYITSGSAAAIQNQNYLPWTDSNMWNNDGDPGKLYNSNGQLVAQWP